MQTIGWAYVHIQPIITEHLYIPKAMRCALLQLFHTSYTTILLQHYKCTYTSYACSVSHPHVCMYVYICKRGQSFNCWWVRLSTAWSSWPQWRLHSSISSRWWWGWGWRASRLQTGPPPTPPPDLHSSLRGREGEGGREEGGRERERKEGEGGREIEVEGKGGKREWRDN